MMKAPDDSRPEQVEATRLELLSIVHRRSETLTVLGFTLIPLFFVLDLFTAPPALFSRFALYRFVTTLIIFVQYFVVHHTKPSHASIAHGYVFSIAASLMTVVMACDLGGFDSSYYAGLSLVIFATNALLPWGWTHSAINSAVVVALYVVAGSIWGGELQVVSLVGSSFFLGATAVVAISASAVQQKLVRDAIRLRAELTKASGARRSEMEIARHIQTALIPAERSLKSYDVAAVMVPADEVSGDYYDIVETRGGEIWIAIGDVSGHGVEAGLIMMMTQTSIVTTVNRGTGYSPSSVLNTVNTVIKENLTRLGSDRYMTISLARLDEDGFTVAGKHQDIMIHRTTRGVTEFVPSKGTWLGLVDDIGEYLEDTRVRVSLGDVVLFSTDGVTEAVNERGEMFGDRRLERCLARHAHLSASEIVIAITEAVSEHMAEQRDDFTLVVLKRGPRQAPTVP